MQCRVLGPLEITIDGVPARVGGHKQRALLGLLIAAAGRVVSVDRLTDDLWGADPPAKASVSLQSYIANLRRVLEPGRVSRAPAQILISRAPGYMLSVPAGGVDAATFQRLASAAHDLVATDPALARERLDAALELWRGDAYADVVGVAPGLVPEALRLGELHQVALEDRWAAEIALGAHTRVIGEIEAFLTAHPLRETAWALLTLGLYRSHRQGDALDALRRARAVLADELGVDPGPELRRLEAAVLAQDRSLARTADPVRTSDRPASDDAPLVGRDDAMARMLGHVTQTTAGRGRLVLVTGEPGIGKTALARAVTVTARGLGLRTGWGTCQASRGAPTRWPWTQALGELLEGVDPATLHTVGAQYPALGGLLPAAVQPGSTTPVMDSDSVSFQQAAAIALLADTVGPSLIVLDDAQRADPDTLAVLRWLAPQIHRLPVVLILTCRDAETDVEPVFADTLGELARRDPDRVRLTGLDLAAVTGYLARYHPAVPHPVVAAVLARTDGNPFYLEEIVRLLVSTGSLTDPAAVTALDVPDGVRDVVRARLAQLPRPVHELLTVAALTGRTFDAEIVQAATDLDADTADDALDVAVTAGLIVQHQTRYRFRHAMVRDAIVDRIGPAQHRRLHARLATAIEVLWATAPQEQYAELAYHYHQAGPGHTRAAWTYAARGAELAAQRPAPAEAVRLSELAATAIAGDRTATAKQRHQVALALILARQRAGQERAAWRTMIDAAETALAAADPMTAAQLAVSIGGDTVWRWREYQRFDPAAVSLFRRLLTELPTEHTVLGARLRAMLATELSYDPAHTGDADELCEQAVNQIRAANDRTPQDLARVLQARHFILDRPPQLVHRMATAQELVRLSGAADDPAANGRALLFRGRDHLEAGHIENGLADYAAARGIAETHQLIPLLVALGFADTVIAIAAGRFSTARNRMRQALALHASTSLPGAQELPLTLAATLHLTRGTLDHAVPILAPVADHPLFREFYALALTKAGRRAAALAATGPWDQQTDPPQDYLWLFRMAIRAHLWSELAPDGPYLREIREQLTPFDNHVAIAGTGIAIAGYLGTWTGLLDRTIGDLDRAVHTLTTAMHHNTDAGFLPFAATTARELAATLQLRNRTGDQERAAAHSADAAALMMRINRADGT
jgi:DNA-binding SARP family transcriptional activator